MIIDDTEKFISMIYYPESLKVVTFLTEKRKEKQVSWK
jgi:hypothetical protein